MLDTWSNCCLPKGEAGIWGFAAASVLSWRVGDYGKSLYISPNYSLFLGAPKHLECIRPHQCSEVGETEAFQQPPAKLDCWMLGLALSLPREKLESACSELRWGGRLSMNVCLVDPTSFLVLSSHQVSRVC